MNDNKGKKNGGDRKLSSVLILAVSKRDLAVLEALIVELKKSSDNLESNLGSLDGCDGLRKAAKHRVRVQRAAIGILEDLIRPSDVPTDIAVKDEIARVQGRPGPTGVGSSLVFQWADWLYGRENPGKNLVDAEPEHSAKYLDRARKVLKIVGDMRPKEFEQEALPCQKIEGISPLLPSDSYCAIEGTGPIEEAPWSKEIASPGGRLFSDAQAYARARELYMDARAKAPFPVPTWEEIKYDKALPFIEAARKEAAGGTVEVVFV